MLMSAPSEAIDQNADGRSVSDETRITGSSALGLRVAGIVIGVRSRPALRTTVRTRFIARLFLPQIEFRPVELVAGPLRPGDG